jgi:uncharacterized protein (UPF0335 family)
MPGFKSYTGLVATSQQLLAAVTANADQLQAAEALRGQFDQAVTQLRDLVTRRDTFKAEKQVMSRQLIDVAQRVVDLGIDLKAMLKAILGSRSEKLTEFTLKPRRKVLRTERPKASAAALAKRKAAAASQAEPQAVSDTTPAA